MKKAFTLAALAAMFLALVPLNAAQAGRDDHRGRDRHHHHYHDHDRGRRHDHHHHYYRPPPPPVHYYYYAPPRRPPAAIIYHDRNYGSSIQLNLELDGRRR